MGKIHPIRAVLGAVLAMMLALPALAEVPGKVPLAEAYGADGLSYSDDSITVSITQGRVHETDYWVARIRLSEPGQLRTAAARDFNSERTIKGLTLAGRMNAVLAINGDYYCYIPDGYLIRNGVQYRNLPSGKRDVLLIDDKGDFYQLPLATPQDIADNADKNILHSFNFGPSLIIDGKRVENYQDNDNAAFKPRQRMALAQVKRGSLEYVAVACAGPRERNVGLTLDQFSKLVAEQGVENAYNLDGGYSTMLMFNGQYVNTSNISKIRDISDIIYFVTLQGEGKAD